MDAYTISKLAFDAGVSVHVVRDYVVRGLLHPAQRTDSGYGIYDAQALVRLRFVRAAFEAGIGLHELTRLCHALDGGAGDAGECLAHLRLLISARRETLALLDRQLARMDCAARPHAEGESHHAASGSPPASRWRAYTWGVLAALTCPCHLPVLAVVLAGTSVGAFVGDHWGIAALALTALFVLSLARALRAFRERS